MTDTNTAQVGMTSMEVEFLNKLRASMEELTDKKTSLKALLYGESGVGKTVLAMQMAQVITPPDRRIIFIDSYQGWATLNNHPALKQRAARLSISGISQFEALATGIKMKAQGFADIGTVVIDEHSPFGELDTLAVTKARAMTDPTKDPEQPMLPDMQISSNRMKQFTAPLVRLEDVNLILVAHMREDKDNVGVLKISPAYLPKLSKHLRNLMMLIGYVEAELREDPATGSVEYIRTVQVMPTRKVVAKTRVGGFNGVYVTPRDLVYGVKEWLDGSRDTVEVDKIHAEEPVPQTEEIETDEITNDDKLTEITDTLNNDLLS